MDFNVKERGGPGGGKGGVGFYGSEKGEHCEEGCCFATVVVKMKTKRGIL